MFADAIPSFAYTKRTQVSLFTAPAYKGWWSPGVRPWRTLYPLPALPPTAQAVWGTLNSGLLHSTDRYYLAVEYDSSSGRITGVKEDDDFCFFLAAGVSPAKPMG